MKYKLISKILPLLSVVCVFSSCKKFLEEAPSKTSSLVVKTTAQIDALLNTQNSFYMEESRTQIYGTDDVGLTVDLYNGGRGVFSTMAAFQFNTWDFQYLPDDTREGFWSGEYKKIFTANLALGNLDAATGTQAEKDIIKADAHFIRAYSY